MSLDPKLVFDDPLHISTQDRFENDEERWQTLGLVGGVVLLLVAHTYQDNGAGESMRIVSAHKATKRERTKYEQNV